MNKTILWAKLSILALMIIIVVVPVYQVSVTGRSVFSAANKTVIIDAGHGLPDGGAVAADGTRESDLNLEIATLVQQKLSAAGIQCIMTRESAESIYTEGKTIHAKKVSDTRKRVAIANSHPDALLLSIHMNTYTTPDVYGMQVFYKAGSDLAQTTAKELQETVNLKYQSENSKKAKPIPSNVYLFQHIKNDAVLAECGFLTNARDLERLQNSDYKESLASTIAEVVAYQLCGSE